jgi:DNA-binding beta-propeller fold protein YncE
MFGRPRVSATLVLVFLFAVAGTAGAQSYPNPYRAVEAWAKLPDGRQMGAVGDVVLDPDGRHVWAVVRCDSIDPERFGDECLDSMLDPILKFDLDGTVVASFGSGLFIWPHGLDVDHDGKVWVTDAVAAARTPPGARGHQVVKFSPAGKVLMTLGTPGVPGDDNGSFNAPSDVVVAGNGDIFVADGHADDTNNRIVKFAADGSFIGAWGSTGHGPGEFRTLHALAIDSRNRLFAADRSNNRIQIFDLDGNYLASWTQFGRPSGIYFDAHDRIYVADSESDEQRNPGWEMGIRIGDAASGWVDSFVLYPWDNPRKTGGNGAEFVAVDGAGNLYAGEPRPHKLQKYVLVRR